MGGGRALLFCLAMQRRACPLAENSCGWPLRTGDRDAVALRSHVIHRGLRGCALAQAEGTRHDLAVIVGFATGRRRHHHRQRPPPRRATWNRRYDRRLRRRLPPHLLRSTAEVLPVWMISDDGTARPTRSCRWIQRSRAHRRALARRRQRALPAPSGTAAAARPPPIPEARRQAGLVLRVSPGARRREGKESGLLPKAAGRLGDDTDVNGAIAAEGLAVLPARNAGQAIVTGIG